MLTGTLVTIALRAGGLRAERRREYCFSLFAVVGIALIVSRVVAVLFTPLTGAFALPREAQGHGGHGASRFSRWFHDTSIGRCATAQRAGRHRGAVRAVARGHELRAPAVFPKSDPRGDDRSHPAQERVAQGDAGGGRPRREAAEGRPRRRALELLRRPGRHPLLSPARRPARQRLLRPGRGGHQGPQGARQRHRPVREGLRHRFRHPARARHAAGAGAPGRLAAAVPRRRPGSDQDPRARARLCANRRSEHQHAQHQLRLERARQGHQGRCGSGSRPRAGHQLAAAGDQHQRHPVGHQDHADARGHVSDRHRRPRHPRGARADRDPAQPDAECPGGRTCRWRRSQRSPMRWSAADLAPPAPADRDRAGRRGAGSRGNRGRRSSSTAPSPTSAPSCRPATAGRLAASSRTAPRRRRASSWCFRWCCSSWRPCS